METQYISNLGVRTEVLQTKPKYVLYARKSTESDEQQALSIDSQVKEMLAIAERENLEVIDIRRESHSAKESGQRPVFKELLEDIRRERFNGILTWAPDRLSRNAGDLGSVVDLMDEKKLVEIRTYGQTFKNSPNEKFLLMILCSQAKLENDNKSINVKRGLRARVEMGLWPGVAPSGYLNEKRMDRKGCVIVDPERGHIIKKIFEKVAHEKWSGRKVYNWLKFDLNYKTATSSKSLSLSNIYLILQNTFYYGAFEYPQKSGNWYTGKHEPLITKELFDLVQAQVKTNVLRTENKEFAFTKLMTCGLCGSGISADEKFKTRKDGSVHRYVYYMCGKSKNRDCKGCYLEEKQLIQQFQELIDTIPIHEISIKEKIKKDITRIKKFQRSLLGIQQDIEVQEIDLRNYAKFILKDGEIEEKRELLGCLNSKIFLKDKSIYTIESS
jgi:DNA invertase Pin-like site-specific DNA recombinase